MTESRQVVRAEVAMLAVVLIWGANFSFMKMALGEMSGLAFAGLRFTLAAFILLAVLVVVSQTRLLSGPMHYFFEVMLGISRAIALA